MHHETVNFEQQLQNHALFLNKELSINAQLGYVKHRCSLKSSVNWDTTPYRPVMLLTTDCEIIC
jgi:hypothetical protein